MPDRVEPSEELAALVMFDADMTCCVCRNPKRKVHIHHIDGDSSNTVYENLAVLCFDCHSDAHTRHAFARNVSQELVAMYNENWRRIVRVQHNETGTISDYLELRQEVLLELELACQSWLDYFMQEGGMFVIVPPADRGLEKKANLWKKMRQFTFVPYSPERWEKVKHIPLELTDRVLQHLEGVLEAYPQGVTTETQIAVLRAARKVRRAQKDARLMTPYYELLKQIEPEVPRIAALIELMGRPFSKMLDAFDDLNDYLGEESMALVPVEQA